MFHLQAQVALTRAVCLSNAVSPHFNTSD